MANPEYGDLIIVTNFDSKIITNYVGFTTTVRQSFTAGFGPGSCIWDQNTNRLILLDNVSNKWVVYNGFGDSVNTSFTANSEQNTDAGWDGKNIIHSKPADKPILLIYSGVSGTLSTSFDLPYGDNNGTRGFAFDYVSKDLCYVAREVDPMKLINLIGISSTIRTSFNYQGDGSAALAFDGSGNLMSLTGDAVLYIYSGISGTVSASTSGFTNQGALGMEVVQEYPPEPITRTETINSNSYIKLSGIDNFINSNAHIFAIVSKTIVSDAYIKKLANDKSIYSDYYIKKIDNDKQIVSDAYIKKEVISVINSNAQITKISQTTLVYPIDSSKDTSPVIFRWQIPSDLDNRNMNSELVVGAIIYKSWVDLGFEYWNGDEWVTYPEEGVNQAYYGNEARKSVTLSTGDVTWKVRGACETI